MVDTEMDLQALLIVGQHVRSTCEPSHRTISNAKKELKCPARDGMAATD